MIVNVENVAQAGVHPARLALPETGMHVAGHFLDHSTTSSVTYLSDAKDGNSLYFSCVPGFLQSHDQKSSFSRTSCCMERSPASGSHNPGS